MKAFSNHECQIGNILNCTLNILTIVTYYIVKNLVADYMFS